MLFGGGQQITCGPPGTRWLVLGSPVEPAQQFRAQQRVVAAQHPQQHLILVRLRQTFHPPPQRGGRVLLHRQGPAYRRSRPEQIQFQTHELGERLQRAGQLGQARRYRRLRLVVVQLSALHTQQPGQIQQPVVTGGQLRPRRNDRGEPTLRLEPLVIAFLVPTADGRRRDPNPARRREPSTGRRDHEEIDLPPARGHADHGPRLAPRRGRGLDRRASAAAGRTRLVTPSGSVRIVAALHHRAPSIAALDSSQDSWTRRLVKCQ